MKLLPVLLLLVIAGCAGTPPQVTTYLLRAATDTGIYNTAGDVEVGLVELNIAPYIDRPGLVLETADGEISSARYHQWAEPLRLSLRQYLGTKIATNLGTDVDWQSTTRFRWRRRIDLSIDQLHGSAAGKAVLVAYWTIKNEQGALISRHQFTESQALASNGYAALVSASKINLSLFAEAVAKSIDLEPKSNTSMLPGSGP